MGNVLGIGGIFFKCRDRDSLAAWYEQHLGMKVNEMCGIEFKFSGMPASGYCVWGPFKGETEYFKPSKKEFMLNLIVDDVDSLLQRAVAGGASKVGEIEEYEFGRFGWFLDPEDNKIELWQPK